MLPDAGRGGTSRLGTGVVDSFPDPGGVVLPPVTLAGLGEVGGGRLFEDPLWPAPQVAFKAAIDCIRSLSTPAGSLGVEEGLGEAGLLICGDAP